MPSVTEEIKDKISISEVVSSYIKLEKAGVNLKARCPFHNEKTPSFFVSPPRNSFHCFGCGKGGDIFSFVQEIEGISFMDALKVLADKAGVVVPEKFSTGNSEKEKIFNLLEAATAFFRSNLKIGSAGAKYLEQRGIERESASNFRLGFAPDGWRNLLDYLKSKGFSQKEIISAGLAIESAKGAYDRFRNRIIFPVGDYSGKIVGFSGRVLPSETSKDEPKYINTPQTLVYEKSKILYGIDKAKLPIREKDECILVEGNTDVVMSHQAGVSNVVGVSGTATTEEHLKIINRLTDNIKLVLDADQAGLKASNKAAMLAFAQGMSVKIVKLPKGLDPADLIEKDKKKWQEITKEGTYLVDFVLQSLMEQELPPKDLFSAIRSYLYPYLVSLRGKLEQDSELKKVAETINSSHDAVRSDFFAWSKDYDSLEKVGDSASKKEEFNRKKTLEEKILGILFWQESVKEPQVKIKELRSDLKELFGEDYFKEKMASFSTRENLGKKENLVFQAEATYESFSDLEKEIGFLLEQLRQETFNGQLQEVIGKLREAEKKGDEENAQRLLEECQGISKKINLLQKK